jgi:enoyl-[acyl-carrier-protein] reductase (NADH)
VLVHSLANGPEVAKPLLETSRNGYLAAVSASSYSYVSMLQRFGPLMNKGEDLFSSSLEVFEFVEKKLENSLGEFFSKKNQIKNRRRRDLAHLPRF